jgi:hypothetical protein
MEFQRSRRCRQLIQIAPLAGMVSLLLLFLLLTYHLGQEERIRIGLSQSRSAEVS